MSFSVPPRAPRFCTHKGSGQAYVYAWSRRIYLGRHDRPEAVQRYHEFVAECVTNGGQPPVEPDQMTIKARS